MTDKQVQARQSTPLHSTDMVAIYNTNANTIHYYLHNLFRGLKSIRRKYKLTMRGISAVNDIDESFARCLIEWFQKNGISL